MAAYAPLLIVAVVNSQYSSSNIKVVDSYRAIPVCVCDFRVCASEGSIDCER